MFYIHLLTLESPEAKFNLLQKLMKTYHVVWPTCKKTSRAAVSANSTLLFLRTVILYILLLRPNVITILERNKFDLI